MCDLPFRLNDDGSIILVVYKTNCLFNSVHCYLYTCVTKHGETVLVCLLFHQATSVLCSHAEKGY